MLDHLGAAQALIFQALAERAAGLAKFHADELASADPKTLPKQWIEANAPCNDIAPGQGQIEWMSTELAKSLDLLGFDQGQVLPRPIGPPGMAITTHTLTGEQVEMAASLLRRPPFHTQK